MCAGARAGVYIYMHTHIFLYSTLWEHNVPLYGSIIMFLMKAFLLDIKVVKFRSLYICLPRVCDHICIINSEKMKLLFQSVYHL